MPKAIRIPPELASKWAIYEYKRIVIALNEKISALDHSLLVDYAQTYSDILDLRSMVEQEGMKLISEKGGEYINPTLNILISRQSHMAALRRDLYFTPKSRVEKQGKVRKGAKALLDGDEE